MDKFTDVIKYEFGYNEKDEEKGLAFLIVAKQRNGPTKTVRATFVDAYTRFENYSDFFESNDMSQ